MVFSYAEIESVFQSEGDKITIFKMGNSGMLIIEEDSSETTL